MLWSFCFECLTGQVGHTQLEFVSDFNFFLRPTFRATGRSRTCDRHITLTGGGAFPRRVRDKLPQCRS